ncbi:ATP-binding protein [Calditrichota bacterium GD2]
MLQLSRQYPAITITGPRQSGKTTLARRLFPQKQYISLENPDVREMATIDPRAFLKTVETGAILDEIQRAPELLSYLQQIIDASTEKGKYILTGSNQFSLLNTISQSLAGRTVLLKLLPFSLTEIADYIRSFSSDDLMYHGFFPAIYKESLNPTLFYRSYYETYIERDLRQVTQVKDLLLFQKFVRLCAGRIAQTFNANQLANEVGVSVPTIKSWLSILQTSFIVFLLPPYFENIRKRLIKSPKLYFYDVGLAVYLLGIENPLQLTRDPLRGALFENMVIAELLKARFNRSLDANFYFYRDHHQNEVDVVFKQGSSFTIAEIKSAQTFSRHFLKGLHYFQKLFPDRTIQKFLIYDGEIEQQVEGGQVLNFRSLSEGLLF